MYLWKTRFLATASRYAAWVAFYELYCPNVVLGVHGRWQEALVEWWCSDAGGLAERIESWRVEHVHWGLGAAGLGAAVDAGSAVLGEVVGGGATKHFG